MNAIGMKLVEGEKFGHKALPPSGSLEVYMKLMKARGYFSSMNKEDNTLARQILEEALPLDPEYSLLYSMLAGTHLLDLFYQSSESPEMSFAQASRNIKKALVLDEDDWLAHLGLSFLYLLRKEHDKAIDTAERALALNPNGAGAYAQLGFVLSISGRPEEGIKLIEKAMRLNPIPPASYLLWLGHSYYFLGQYEDAIEVYEELLRRSPKNLFAHIWLTANYSALGRDEEGRRQAEELLRLDPGFSLDQFVDTVAIKDRGSRERFIDDLREAGLE
jgi:adenylate cyclase